MIYLQWENPSSFHFLQRLENAPPSISSNWPITPTKHELTRRKIFNSRIRKKYYPPFLTPFLTYNRNIPLTIRGFSESETSPFLALQAFARVVTRQFAVVSRCVYTFDDASTERGLNEPTIWRRAAFPEYLVVMIYRSFLEEITAD